MGLKRTGLDPLAYLGVEPSSPSQFVIEEDNPNQNDWQNFNVGTVWLNETTQVPWMLVSLARNQATWITLGGSSSSGVQTLTTDGPTVVNPTSGNINVFSGTGIATSGSGSTVTVGVAADVPTTFQSGNDSSTAAPVFNTITFTGSGDSTVSAAGNVVTINSTGGSTGHPLITTYSTPGTYTWTKAAGTTFMAVYATNGGLGGGSGARYPNQQSTGGGAGANGTSEALIAIQFPASYVGSSEPVVVGAGGLGGAAVTTDNTPGNNGAVGGTSSFALLSSPGSSPIAGQGGLHFIYVPNSSTATALNGGRNGSVIAGSITQQDSSPAFNTQGLTGAGNGATTTPGSGVGLTYQAGTGAPVFGTFGSFSLAGGVAGTIGSPNGGNGQDAPVGIAAGGNFLQSGSGGGGGFGQTGASLPGNGGNGGFPGGPGGGGGASLNGTASGAGGNGANGMVIVIEW